MQIRVFVLDLIINDRNYNQYSQKTAKNKIDFLSDEIHELVKNSEEKDVTPVVVWREHGITESSGSNVVSTDIEKYLLEKMQSLVDLYPNLIIIPGTILVESELKCDLEELKESYKNHFWIHKMEEKYGQRLEFREHLKQFFLFYSNTKEAKTKIVNRSFIIAGKNWQVLNSKKSYATRDKVAPCEETKELFKLGGKHSGNPLVVLKNLITGIELPILVLICREVGFLYTHKNYSVQPVLQFILSNTAKLPLLALEGLCVIHADSKYEPQHVCTQREQEGFTIEVFKVKILKKLADTHAKILLGPLLPSYPLQLAILDILLETITDLKELHSYLERILQNDGIALQASLKPLKSDLSLNQQKNLIVMLLNVAEKSIRIELPIKLLLIIGELWNKILAIDTLRRSYIEAHSQMTVPTLAQSCEWLKKKLKETVFESSSEICQILGTRDTKPFTRSMVEAILTVIKTHEEDPNAQELNSIKESPAKVKNTSPGEVLVATRLGKIKTD